MNYIESWNEIVSEYNDNLNRKEDIVQKTWEILFKLCFEYSKSNIDSQRPVQMGSTPKYPDIIIKNNGEDLFVVELKKHTRSDSKHDGQKQLFSYLNQLKIDLGILVWDNLYLFDYDYISKDDEFHVLEIPFISENPNGVKFVELFSKENFDRQKIKDFIKESNENKNMEIEMKNELTVNLVKELLSQYFSKKYPSIDVESIISEYNISLMKKNLYVLNNSNTRELIHESNSSGEIYLFNNISYPKRRFVLAVVSDYVRNNPNITYDHLKLIFPDDLQGGYGVFQDDALVLNTVLSNRKNKEREYKRRYFTNSNEKIFLQAESRTIIVSGEWGDNFIDFFNRAKELGLNVAKR